MEILKLVWRTPGGGLASILARWYCGLMFAMVGYFKVFSMGVTVHAEKFFVTRFADSWIPEWLLSLLGHGIPLVELIGGALVCLGLWVREATSSLGIVLILVAYGHLLETPFYDSAPHMLPRVLMVLAVFLLYERFRDQDRLALDWWLSQRGGRPHGPAEDRAG